MNSVRFGLVGYGSWGKCHARAIRQTSGCELGAVCSASEKTRKAAAMETGAPVHADFRELVARPDIDVVDIVVPSHLHEQVACAALEAGKHVLLEKPMSVSVDSCDRILRTARKMRRLL